MAKIQVLSKDISELIAAGEVIERPASVIKEVVENSIDAGATHITVEIKNGGTTFMRIIDDGCGIAFEDLPTAFLRHATSKIISKDDLDNIFTLGFRGEALASVSAVSKVEVISKTADNDYGSRYCIEGSVETLHEKTGASNGTAITIRNLFYNVPVRQRFMKKDVAEGNAISQIVQKIALSHPEIAFKFVRDNKVEFNSSGDGELYSAIYAVYGRDFARDLMKVEYELNGIKVRGFIIRPLYSKSNRTFQNFFVNGRYVKSKTCQTALESGYENMIMTGKFPACILMLEMLPVNIDVNIHPAKAEIRFSNEKSVSDAVYFAVKSAMLKNGLIYEFQINKEKQDLFIEPEVEPELKSEVKPEIKPDTENYSLDNGIFTSPENIVEKEQNFTETINPKRVENISALIDADFDDELIEEELEPKKIDIPEKLDGFSYINESSFIAAPEPEESKAEMIPKADVSKDKIKVIGEAFMNYIMAEVEENIIMIDKHAAHERVIFERLKSQNCKQYMQMMLDGGQILLSMAEFDAIENNIELLENMGFVFDLSQKPYITPTGVPSFLIDLDVNQIISEVAENLMLGKQNPQSHTLDDILHTIACKSAIKANDYTNIQELQKLAEEVYYSDNIRHCPHGRPVMFTLSKNNIEKQFKRKL